ncbi:MAG: CDP-alcohol phosphatidyltransferase family protein [Saprospiraceae bacterium]|nr:CDP-alcohol phosphatidyltransferase family protein [Saprospiraceae bacterium]
MRQQIPNFFTLSNLFCGCCALVLLLNGEPVAAAWFTLGSFVCDYADGMAARALGVSSPMGRELDSLADVVSFGVVPGMMLYGMLTRIQGTPAIGWTLYPPLSALPFAAPGALPWCLAATPAFVLSMFSAYRLAKFNLDTRQKNYFIGLSTPGCTVFVLGLCLSVQHNRFGCGEFFMAQPWLVYALVGLFSYLLVSEIPMFGMKIRSLRLRDNLFSLAFLAVFILLVLFLKELAFSAVIVLYILVSIVLKNRILSGEPI